MTVETIGWWVILIAPILLAVVSYFFFRYVRTRQQKPSWLCLLSGNVLLLLLFSSLLLLSVETYYRFVFDETMGNNASKVSMRWFARYWHVNAFGVRDNIQLKLRRDPGFSHRLTFLGDSFTAGHGINNVDDRFANLIRHTKPQWDVQVVAMNGLGTVHELGLLKNLLSNGYEIDAVVLVYCYNDVEPFIDEMKYIYANGVRPPEHFAWLMGGSYAIDTYYYRLKRRSSVDVADKGDYFSMLIHGYEGAPWEKQREAMRQLRDLVEANGGRLFVVTFPLLFRLEDNRANMEKIHLQLRSAWNALGVDPIDLLPIFERYNSRDLVVNQDDDHPNVFAHGLAAAAISGALDERLGRRTPQPEHE